MTISICRATSPAVDLDKKRGVGDLTAADSAGASGALVGRGSTSVGEIYQTREHRYHHQHRQQRGKDAAAWTDRTREALVGATIGAAYAHGKSYLR